MALLPTTPWWPQRIARDPLAARNLLTEFHPRRSHWTLGWSHLRVWPGVPIFRSARDLFTVKVQVCVSCQAPERHSGRQGRGKGLTCRQWGCRRNHLGEGERRYRATVHRIDPGSAPWHARPSPRVQKQLKRTPLPPTPAVAPALQSAAPFRYRAPLRLLWRMVLRICAQKCERKQKCCGVAAAPVRQVNGCQGADPTVYSAVPSLRPRWMRA
jgi:hypothetical protein